MSKTIEERAIEAAQDFTYTELDAGTIIEEHTHGEYNAYKQGFSDGAIDQRKIDTNEENLWIIYNFINDWKSGKYGIMDLESCAYAYLKTKAMED